MTIRLPTGLTILRIEPVIVTLYELKYEYRIRRQMKLVSGERRN